MSGVLVVALSRSDYTPDQIHAVKALLDDALPPDIRPIVLTGCNGTTYIPDAPSDPRRGAGPR